MAAGREALAQPQAAHCRQEHPTCICQYHAFLMALKSHAFPGSGSLD